MGTANCEAMFDYLINPRYKSMTNVRQQSIVTSYIVFPSCFKPTSTRLRQVMKDIYYYCSFYLSIFE